ncbi:putative RNA-binding protein (virulence factor B family) [Rhizobium mongolense]|uniref:Putative RNA-binding protein (Virulence factor B family) n=1 Tax=Rhizobium mongolense TaxID=57676 RepID=A0A7W6RPU4_9HYPH|nr:putative RNA-binding protein (virulence factor B family) [Rhizobium mongolense]
MLRAPATRYTKARLVRALCVLGAGKRVVSPRSDEPTWPSVSVKHSPKLYMRLDQDVARRLAAVDAAEKHLRSSALSGESIPSGEGTKAVWWIY